VELLWYPNFGILLAELLVILYDLGTAAAVPPQLFRLGNPALCGSHPLVTPFEYRLEDLLCFYVFAYCIIGYLCIFCFFQYFDTVGWVF